MLSAKVEKDTNERLMKYMDVEFETIESFKPIVDEFTAIGFEFDETDYGYTARKVCSDGKQVSFKLEIFK
jgi:hypothetical protein